MSAPSAFPEVDPQRSRIAALVLLFFLLLPAEGILRKWVFNGIQQPLTFVRDPVLALIYMLYANWRGPKRLGWFPVWGLAAAATIGLSLAEATTGALPPLVYALGWRSYILYIPLMFIMRDVLLREDMTRYLRVSLFISIPIGVLVAVQFFSPVASPINRGLDETVLGRFLVAEGVVRPYGPFTFVAAQATFSVLMLANLMVAFERRAEINVPRWIWAAATAASLTMGALSGARTYFIGAATVTGFYFLGALFAPNVGRKAARFGLGFAVIGAFVVTFVFIFPRAFETMSARQQNAVHAEGSTVQRAVSMITSVSAAVAGAQPLGVGIGAGSNAGAAARGETGFWTLGEYDWPRIVVETGPGFGLAYLAFRVLGSLYLLVTAATAARINRDVSSMVMCGIAFPTLLAAQITGQNQMLSFCWFTCGLTLALSRSGTGRSNGR